MAESQPQQFTFQLKVKDFPVVLVDDEGKPQGYVLREFDGATRDEYLEAEKNRVDHKRQVIRNFDKFQASLLAKCFHEADLELDAKGICTEVKSVGDLCSVEFIQSLPAFALGQLFDKALEMSGLSKDADKEGNED